MNTKTRDWIVRMKCEVVKDVMVTGCTEEEARNDPWQYAADEVEIEQPNWEVQSVKPNE